MKNDIKIFFHCLYYILLKKLKLYLFINHIVLFQALISSSYSKLLFQTLIPSSYSIMTNNKHPIKNNIQKLTIRYSNGPSLDGSIGFTKNRNIPSSNTTFIPFRNTTSTIHCYDCSLYYDICCCEYY